MLVALSNALTAFVLKAIELSFSRILTVAALLVSNNAPLALLSTTRKVSLVSNVVSSVIGTVIVRLLVPGPKLSVPLVNV